MDKLTEFLTKPFNGNTRLEKVNERRWEYRAGNGFTYYLETSYSGLYIKLADNPNIKLTIHSYDADNPLNNRIHINVQNEDYIYLTTHIYRDRDDYDYIRIDISPESISTIPFEMHHMIYVLNVYFRSLKIEC